MKLNIDIVKHLEYLGYEIVVDNSFIILVKPDHKQLRSRDGKDFLFFNCDYLFRGRYAFE